MNRKVRTNNTRIIANALFKGKVEYVWLKDVTGKPVKVLKESLHKHETTFLDAGNEVDYDCKRHKRKSVILSGVEV